MRFVLVHGAWHGGWCWRDVRAELEKRGHEVHTPTLPGLAERASEMSRNLTLGAMVDDVVGFLVSNDLHDAVLVGHSFSGTVVTGVADRVPERLVSLVYLDAAVPKKGETAFDGMPANVAAQRRLDSEKYDGGISMPPPPGSAFGLTEAQSWAIDRLSPHPLASYESPLQLEHPVGNGLPVRYIACTDPSYANLKQSRKRAAALGWPIETLPSGHDAMILAPTATTKALVS